MTSPLLVQWQTFLRDAGANSAFERHPSELIRRLEVPRPLPGGFLQYLNIIRNSEWNDELALIVACVAISQMRGKTNYGMSETIRQTVYILQHCSRILKGKGNVRPEIHLKYEFFVTKGSKYMRHDLWSHFKSFGEALEIVEQILPTLPISDQIKLKPFQIEIQSEYIYDALNPNSIEYVRSLILEEYQQLRDTALSNNYTGILPEKAILRFFAKDPEFPRLPEATQLIIYALTCVAQGEDQAVLLKRLETYYSCYSLIGTPRLGKNETCTDGLQQWETPEAREVAWHIFTTLKSRRDVRPLLSIFGEPQDEETPPPQVTPADKALSWSDMFSERHLSSDLQQIFETLLPISKTNSLGDAALQGILKFLGRSRETPFFMHLAATALCVMVNREHRPNSALQMLRHLRDLLKLVAQAGDLPAELYGEHILRVLEMKKEDDRQIAKSRRLAVAYGAACQSRQTFRAQYPQYAARLDAWPLPPLPRRAVLQRPEGAQQTERAERRRNAIDQVADNWVALHQEADRRYMAFRTVMLAVRMATYRLDPTQVKKGQPLSIHVPGLDETWHLTIWTRSTFYREVYGHEPPMPLDDRFFLEYRGSTGPQGLWCEEILRAWLSGAAAEQFERDWHYSVKHLRATEAGGPSNRRARGPFLRGTCSAGAAPGKPVPCVFDQEAVYRGVLFGVLALRIGRYGGHRGHELLQLQTNDETLFVKRHRGHELLLMRFYPKGRKGTRVNPSQAGYKVITPDALRIVEAVEANRGYTGEAAQETLTDIENGQASQDHVFRVRGRVLSVATINACLRFVLHGQLAFNDETDAVLARTHLMRYGFAVHAKANGVHLNDLAIMLNHKNPEITEKYSRQTRRQQFHTLASVAVQAGMWSALGSDQVPQVQQVTAEPLLTVPGGQCTYLSECHDARACVGCAFKHPDPARRLEAERFVHSLNSQLEQAKAAGWQDARRLEIQLRDAETELSSMDFQQSIERIESVLDEQERALLQVVRQRRP